MTLDELRNYVKSLIAGEGDPQWTPEEINLYIKVGLTLVSASFWYLLFPTYKKFVDKNLVADEDKITLPDGCQKVVLLEYSETGEPCKYIEEDQLWKYATASGDPQAWIFHDKNIKLIPKPSQSKTNYFRLWYLPRPATIADLPEELHPLVGIEAILSAKIKDEDLTADLQVLHKRFVDVGVTALSVAQVQEPDQLANHERYDLEDF